TPAAAQETPRRGGELVFVVAAEPPSFDAHQEETFAMLHPGAPQYNTLMRVDPTDRTGTKLVGDLAESWTISPDRRIYPFRVGKRNPDYWDKGKPYLDGFRAIFIPSASAQVAAVRGERAMIQFRSFTPADRDSLVNALGSKITVQESAWNCSIGVTPNEQKKPYEDKRVRR